MSTTIGSSSQVMNDLQLYAPIQINPTALEQSFTRGLFVLVSPPDAEQQWGFVHLYRAGQAVPETGNISQIAEDEASFDPRESNIFCIPEIPSYVSPSDLLGFLGPEGREIISHIRLLRTEASATYMALLKFRDVSGARMWKSELEGAPFSSLRSETCTLLAISSVTFQSSENNKLPIAFPSVPGDPFIPGFDKERAVKSVQPQASIGTHDSIPPAMPSGSSIALASCPNLPTTQGGGRDKPPEAPGPGDASICPVCLESMDDGAVGVVTILCQHTFHSACLEKWRGNTCPVCRYSQNQSIDLKTRLGDLSDHECSVCRSSANLWICLICGNIGCGRYDSAHAFAHHEETGHSFAMDIATQAVWDYVGDGYVNRLIHNKDVDDGPDSFSSGGDANSQGHLTALGADMVPREKVEAMSSEYTYLLSSQMFTQRLFYEEQARVLSDNVEEAMSKLRKAEAENETVKGQVATLQRAERQLREEQKATIRKLEKATKRADECDSRVRDAEKQREEEKALNKMLMDKLKFVKTKLEEEVKERERMAKVNRDLQDEVRDLNFFISSQDQIGRLDEAERSEIAEGSLVVETKAGASSSKKKRKSKKKGIPTDVLAALQANVAAQADEAEKGE